MSFPRQIMQEKLPTVYTNCPRDVIGWKLVSYAEGYEQHKGPFIEAVYENNTGYQRKMKVYMENNHGITIFKYEVE